MKRGYTSPRHRSTKPSSFNSVADSSPTYSTRRRRCSSSPSFRNSTVARHLRYANWLSYVGVAIFVQGLSCCWRGISIVCMRSMVAPATRVTS